MKVLQLAAGDFFSTYGGGQVYVKNLVVGLLGASGRLSVSSDRLSDIVRKVEVAIVSFTGVKETVKKDYQGIDLYEVPENCSYENLIEVVRQINPDIIHAHSHKNIACRAGKSLEIPVVVTAHHGGILCPAGALLNSEDNICYRKLNHKDCLPCVLRNTRTGLTLWYPFMKHLPEDKYLSLGRFLNNKLFIPFITPIGSAARISDGKRRYWEEVVDKCTLMIAPSEAIAKAMIANGLGKDKVRIVTHGIPMPKERPPFPEIKHGKIKFFYVGRICYVKGIHVLLEAFSKVDNPDIELHLIGGAGNKTEQRYMTGLQKKYTSDIRIKWHGKIASDKVFETIKNFHVSISVPIYMEIFGLNIAESLAIGKPVLATCCGGSEMQIEDGVNGWLIEPNNVKQLENKITEIIKNSDSLKKMSENCKAISIEGHCKSLLDIYSELVTRS